MLALELAALGLLAAAPAAASVQIELSVANAHVDQSDDACALTLVPVGGVNEVLARLEPRTRPCGPLPGSQEVLLEVGAVWELRASSERFWAAPQALAVTDASDRAVTLRLWPVAFVKGRLRAPKGSAVPERISARFEPPRRDLPGEVAAPSEREPAGEVSCPVADEVFTCAVPAALLDIRLSARGFVSRRLWDVALRVPGGSHDTGTWSLVEGASIVGRVLSADERLPLAGCAVGVEPAYAALPDRETITTHGQLATRVKTDSRGDFVLEGLPPGRYRLALAREGYAEASVFPLIVEERAETLIRDPILLSRPLDLRVEVAPPLDPTGRPRLVDLQEASVFGQGAWSSIFRGATDEAGVLTRAGLRPGPWLLIVEDAAGNQMERREVELTEAMTTFSIEMEGVMVVGVVTLGREPIAASLLFLGERGAAIHAQADGDGAFELSLPREGRYSVEVELDEPHVRRTLRGVRVERGDEPHARLRLELDATRVEGMVTDEKGRRFSGARVELQDLAAAAVLGARSAGDGRFSFSGVAEGRPVLVASAEDEGASLRSDPVVVEVKAEQPNPPLTLVLRRDAELTGRVVSHTGQGVAHARVVLAPDGIGSGPGDLGQAVTDLSGSFRIKLGAGTRGGVLLALAPGFALCGTPWTVAQRHPAEVRVDPFGGTLVFDLSAVVEARAAGDSFVAVYQDGVLLVLDFLAHVWAPANGVAPSRGHEQVIPRMAAASYRACLLPRSVLLAPGSSAAAPICAAGNLGPGGELRLVLPAR